uniref:Uncharacterized protein n=1 Tax=Trichuris muris TaxID=70415 RepID=A0A5S6QK90_TRIMR
MDRDEVDRPADGQEVTTNAARIDYVTLSSTQATSKQGQCSAQGSARAKVCNRNDATTLKRKFLRVNRRSIDALAQGKRQQLPGEERRPFPSSVASECLNKGH